MNHTPLEIIFEDPFLCIFNKPTNLHSVIVKDSEHNSVAAILLSKNPELKSVANNAGDAGLVNRLDYETTGILIGAKTKEVWQALHKQQQNTQQTKEYYIILEGIFPPKERISTWIYSRYRSSKKVTLLEAELPQPPRSLLGETTFVCVKNYKDKNLSVVKASTTAARRHQIRAQAAWIGHPLCGDQLYGANYRLADFFDYEVPQFALHAAAVKLVHPVTSEQLNITAKLPQYFEQL